MVKKLLPIGELNLANLRDGDRKGTTYRKDDVQDLFGLFLENTKLAYQELKQTKAYKDQAEEYAQEKENLASAYAALKNLKEKTEDEIKQESQEIIEHAKIQAENIKKQAEIDADSIRRKAEDDVKDNLEEARLKKESAKELESSARIEHDKLIQQAEASAESIIKTAEASANISAQKIIDSANNEATTIVGQAKSDANDIQQTCESEVKELMSTAKHQAQSILGTAKKNALEITTQIDKLTAKKDELLKNLSSTVSSIETDMAVVIANAKNSLAELDKTTVYEVKATEKIDIVNKNEDVNVQEKQPETDNPSELLAQSIVNQYAVPAQKIESPDEIQRYLDKLLKK